MVLHPGSGKFVFISITIYLYSMSTPLPNLSEQEVMESRGYSYLLLVLMQYLCTFPACAEQQA